jgi:choline kinase
MQLIYLAAGRGSRLGKLTKKLPKCLCKINNKTILDYIIPIFKDFTKVIIVTGYQSLKVKNKLKKIKNIELIENYSHKTTNMVYSMFLSSPYINNDDLIICYGDIIFDLKIIKKMNTIKKNIIPLNINWLELWKKRMPLHLIKKDAENVILKKNKIISIGEKIKDKIPKFQYMGLLKINNSDFKRLNKFFKRTNARISMTNFINLAISKKVIKFYALKSNLKWSEIDTINDKLVTEKIFS